MTNEKIAEKVADMITRKYVELLPHDDEKNLARSLAYTYANAYDSALNFLYDQYSDKASKNKEMIKCFK